MGFINLALVQQLFAGLSRLRLLGRLTTKRPAAFSPGKALPWGGGVVAIRLMARMAIRFMVPT